MGTELAAKRLSMALKSPVREVLFETLENGYAIGHTKEFFEVAVPCERPLHGEMHSVLLDKVENGRLIGRLMR